MRLALLVLTLLVATATPAAADSVFPIEDLRIIVRVPAAAGAWKLDPTLSKPDDVALFDDDSVLAAIHDSSPRLSCRDFVEAFRQQQGGVTEAAGGRGLDASWWSEVAFIAVPAESTDSLVACLERAGQQLIALFTGYPRDQAARTRAATFANAVAAGWNERVDGVQRLEVGGYALTVRDRRTLWWTDPTDGGLLRLWDQPTLGVTVRRNQVSMISADDRESCESWMKALGKMYTPTPGASFVPAQWHPDAVVNRGADDLLAVACLPRRGGGTMLAEILYGGDPSTGELDRAVRPLLAALAEVAGEPPPVAAVPAALPAFTPSPGTPAPYGVPEGRSAPRRDPYQAYTAPSVSASYLRLAPSLDGAAPSDGLALGLDLPALPRDRRGRGRVVLEGAALVGYHREAGVAFDARAGAGYHLGSLRAALVPVVGAGVDMIDHGDEAAPFHASLAGYAYLGAIARYLPSEALAIEVRGATVARAGVLDETQLSGRVTFLRGPRRKLSVEVSWRRFEPDTVDTVGAELISIGVGIGR